MPEDLTRARRPEPRAWTTQGRGVRPGAERNWATDEIAWGISRSPRPSVGSSPTSRARTSSSSAAARRTSRRGSRARGARPVGVDVTPAQLETARRMQAEARARVPARRGERRGRPAAGRVASTSRSRSTAPRSGATPTAGSPRRRGSCARRAAGLPRQLDALDPLLARRRAGRGPPAPAPAARTSGCGGSTWVGRAVDRLPPRLRRLDPASSAPRLRGRATRRAPRPRPRRRPLRLRHAEWARAWPSEEIWTGAKASRERAARAAAPPRLDLAPAPRDPRAARAPVRRRRARLRGARPAGRRPGRARRSARAGQGALRRGEAGDRPGARRRHDRRLDGRVFGKPAGAEEAEAMLEALGGRDARGRLGPLPASRPVGRSVEHGDDARDLPPADRRATSPRYVARGEWEGRAGAYAIQGLGAQLVERIEGDYLNVVGAPGRAARPPAGRALRGRVRLRLARPG